MKIIVDAMGGDNAPYAIVKGCVDAVNQYGLDVLLTGDYDAVKEELGKYTYPKDSIQIERTTEVISNNEHPVMAVRRKKDSSLVVGLKLLKEGLGDAFISAGSTGALLTGATLITGRIKGINRPALAPLLPGKNGAFMIIDVGANVDCKPINLLQFALMGSIYFKSVMNVDNPKIGLVNNGAEEEKGNELTKAAHALLKKEKGINFVGNIEPRYITEGDIQVVVCDGFVGNAMLKTFEGSASLIFGSLKEELTSSAVSKLGALILKPSFSRLKKKFDYTEYGGAPFLGVNGGVIKAHGSSNDKAIKNAVRQAKLFLENKVVEKIKDSAKSYDDTAEGPSDKIKK